MIVAKSRRGAPQDIQASCFDEERLGISLLDPGVAACSGTRVGLAAHGTNTSGEKDARTATAKGDAPNSSPANSSTAAARCSSAIAGFAAGCFVGKVSAPAAEYF